MFAGRFILILVARPELAANILFINVLHSAARFPLSAVDVSLAQWVDEGGICSGIGYLARMHAKIVSNREFTVS